MTMFSFAVVVPLESVSATVTVFSVPSAPETPLSSPFEGPGAAVMVQVNVVAVLVSGAPQVKPLPGEVDWMNRVLNPGFAGFSVTVRTDVNDWLYPLS